MSFKDFVYMVFALAVSLTIAVVSGIMIMEQFVSEDWLSAISGFHQEAGWFAGIAAFYYSFKSLKNDVLGFKFVSEKPRKG